MLSMEVNETFLKRYNTRAAKNVESHKDIVYKVTTLEMKKARKGKKSNKTESDDTEYTINDSQSSNKKQSEIQSLNDDRSPHILTDLPKNTHHFNELFGDCKRGGIGLPLSFETEICNRWVQMYNLKEKTKASITANLQKYVESLKEYKHLPFKQVMEMGGTAESVKKYMESHSIQSVEEISPLTPGKSKLQNLKSTKEILLLSTKKPRGGKTNPRSEKVVKRIAKNKMAPTLSNEEDDPSTSRAYYDNHAGQEAPECKLSPEEACARFSEILKDITPNRMNLIRCFALEQAKKSTLKNNKATTTRPTKLRKLRK